MVRPVAVLTGLVSIGVLAGSAALAQMEMEQTPAAPPATAPDQAPGQVPGQAPGQAPQVQEGMPTDTANMNLVQVAAASDAFSTLAQAIQAAGLADTLATRGPYTILAPTNAAFQELPQGAVELLLQPQNRALLQQVLTYHVIPGDLTANQLPTGSVDTLGGGVAIARREGRIVVNDASVVNPDIQASNGVIHGINRVLMPEELRQAIAARLNQAQ